MQFINIIYGDDYNDADILLVPDLVCNINMEIWKMKK